MNFVMHVCGWFSTLVVLYSFCEAALPKDTYMTVPQKVAASGYPIQKHRVVTSDGYIIQMHRIPAGKDEETRGNTQERKRAVLLLHGLGGCSDNFVVMGPNRSLSYILADAGFDVWLGNFRGNLYTSHKTLTRGDPQFWKFRFERLVHDSFHEHGKTDLPAMIDHVLSVTENRKLMYVGHSMGTTSFFIMLALRPEYNEKVVSFIALAPAVYLDNAKPLAKDILKDRKVADNLREKGVNSLNVPQYVIDTLINRVCIAKLPKDDVCMKVIYSVVGEDYEQNDWEKLPAILASIQPMALNQLEHYGKIAYNSVFTTFEGGMWGPVKPYNLSNVRVPSLLIYGENDQLTQKAGIRRLADELKAIGSLEDMIPACDCPKFNHLDLAIAKDVGMLLNKPLVNVINRLYDKYYPGNGIQGTAEGEVGV